MKKRNLWTWVSALLLTLVLAITGCDSDSDSDGGGGGGAQYGQVSGIVTDSITNEPIQGATVALGNYTTTTNANGVYNFANVPVGDYPISFTKAGYAYHDGTGAGNTIIGSGSSTRTSGVITVSPTAYKDVDPDGEWHALKEQLTALKDYVNQYPDESPPTSSGSGTWEYAGDGVYVNGSGATIQYQDGQFKIVDYKLNYNYSFGIQVSVIKMVPLSGKLSGKILAVFEKYNEILPTGSTAALANIEFSIAAGTSPSYTTYGPYKTGADGSFTAANLPASSALNFVIPAFTLTSGGAAYSFLHDGRTGGTVGLYQFSLEGGLGASSATNIPAIGSVEVNLGTLYLFTVGDTALVTEASVGTYANPLPVTGTDSSIVFTFSKPMDPSTLPSLTLAGVTLKDSWNSDNTVLTLTPFSYLDKASILRLPYATAVSGITGTLNLAPTSASPPYPSQLTAADGSPVYPSTFDIYTVRGLTLESYEVTSAPAAPRAVSLAPDQVVKLSFSKEISTRAADVSVSWGSNAAVYSIENTGGKGNVYVYPPATLTDTALTFTVAAADDPSNTCSNTGSPIAGLTFSLEADIALSHVNATPYSSGITIAQNQNITIDFNKAFDSATATLYFRYNYGTSSYQKEVKTDTAQNQRSLTIAPDNLLAKTDANVTYVLIYEATVNGVTVDNAASPITVTVGAQDTTKGPAKNAAGNGTLTINGSVNSGSSTINLDFTPPSLSFAQTYSLLYKIFDAQVWTAATDSSGTVTFAVPRASTTVINISSVNIPGDTPHATGDNIQYIVQGVNDTGYVTQTSIPYKPAF